jgi:hypothetical protein
MIMQWGGCATERDAAGLRSRDCATICASVGTREMRKTLDNRESAVADIGLDWRFSQDRLFRSGEMHLAEVLANQILASLGAHFESRTGHLTLNRAPVP